MDTIDDMKMTDFTKKIPQKPVWSFNRNNLEKDEGISSPMESTRGSQKNIKLPGKTSSLIFLLRAI